MDAELATTLASWGPIALMVLIFYFLLYKPQKRAQRERDEMLKSLQKGTRIITIGGIFGTITNLTDKVIKLQIADNVEIEVSRSAIGSVVADDKTVDDDDDDDI